LPNIGPAKAEYYDLIALERTIKYIKKNNIQNILVLSLKYVDKERVITGLKKISKPGLRVYVKAEEVPTVLNGLGIAIISTSKGVMTDKEARANSLGGEVLAYIW